LIPELLSVFLCYSGLLLHQKHFSQDLNLCAYHCVEPRQMVWFMITSQWFADKIGILILVTTSLLIQQKLLHEHLYAYSLRYSKKLLLYVFAEVKELIETKTTIVCIYLNYFKTRCCNYNLYLRFSSYYPNKSSRPSVQPLKCTSLAI